MENVNEKLIAKLPKKLLGNDERVVLIVQRDPIVILGKIVERILQITIILTMGFCVKDVTLGLDVFFPGIRELPLRMAAIVSIVLALQLYLGDYWNYENELLVFTRGKIQNRAIYISGYWRKKTFPVNLKQVVSTPIRQNRAYYQSLLETGDIKLGTVDDEDIYIKDIGSVYDVVTMANGLV